jgi:hypothetical protein
MGVMECHGTTSMRETGRDEDPRGVIVNVNVKNANEM